MNGQTVLCVHCNTPVVTTNYPGTGTVWTHADGYRDCQPTYAAPRL